MLMAQSTINFEYFTHFKIIKSKLKLPYFFPNNHPLILSEAILKPHTPRLLINHTHVAKTNIFCTKDFLVSYA